MKFNGLAALTVTYGGDERFTGRAVFGLDGHFGAAPRAMSIHD